MVGEAPALAATTTPAATAPPMNPRLVEREGVRFSAMVVVSLGTL
jgi:hypothetical protein